ncbi:hypothetical protein NG895_12930 [Aeoliella sp. ICT_H6.2]|uniref:Carboxypeptidase regulatory-like domain-containing protein n=1 Tax=Aeoliella straminimaris TaxID=2954799 RepID=A0A9X2FEF7_9BACT|nr:hypothetical protein [Aeoliella straminimaris]MCO6044809.1 hypothetical protein [Aeoliella straminimaris]
MIAKRPFTSSSLALGFILVTCVTGCGGDTAQVSGHVEYEDGSPLVGAIRVIRFEPTEDSKAVVRKVASSPIADDGSFELVTKRPGDGVYKGKYKVTFTVLESPATGVSLIKPEYTTAMDSPLEVSVDHSGADYNFTLEKL